MAIVVPRHEIPYKLHNFSFAYDKTATNHNQKSLFTCDYPKHADVAVIAPAVPPASGQVIGGDDRINDRKSEAVNSFIDHKTRKYGCEYDQNAMRKTNFKIHSDPSKIPFEKTDNALSYVPKFSSKLKSCRQYSDDVWTGDVKNLRMPVSTYKDKFGAHDVEKAKAVKMYSRHYDSYIIRDPDHSYDVTSREAFPGVTAPRVRSIYPATGTRVPLGDRDKIPMSQSTMREEYPDPVNQATRPGFSLSETSREMRRTNIKAYDGGVGYSTITATDFIHTPGKPSEAKIKERNKSCVPSGDEDQSRCVDMINTTSHGLEFTPQVHWNHHNPIVSGAPIMTKSNVQFAPDDLQDTYYDTTMSSVYVPQPVKREYDRTKYHIPSSIPVTYYLNENNFASTQRSDYKDSKTPKMAVSRVAKGQISQSHMIKPREDRDFQTTHGEQFPYKTGDVYQPCDPHRFQRSSVPLGGFS